jgi:hypothetical protein
VHQQALFLELAHDLAVALLDPTPGVFAELGLELAGRQHGAEQLDLVGARVALELALVRVVIVLAEGGRAWKPSILDRYYSAETLRSELARKTFVMPDVNVQALQ